MGVTGEMGARVAVVTGASRGIGREIAKELVARGLHVIATSRDEGHGKKTADEVGATFFPLDVTSPASIEALGRRVAESGVDVLVNNAGVAPDGNDPGTVGWTVAVNYIGAVRTTERLLPTMRAGGRIVMVSSGMGELASLREDLRARFADPNLAREELNALVMSFLEAATGGTLAESGWPSKPEPNRKWRHAYRVSKAALNAYVRILGAELELDARRIKVNAACPGWVRTRLGGPCAPRTVADGASTPVWLATLPDDGPTGGFFRDQLAIPW